MNLKIHRIKGVSLLLAIMLVCSSCMTPIKEESSLSESSTESLESFVNDLSDESSKPEPESQPDIVVSQPVTVRLKAVGDNLIHSSIYQQAHQRAGGEGYDYRYAYENVKDMFGDADISSINQESIIAPIYEPSTYPCFNASAELGDLMLEYGFDVFNLANNHCLDKGESGILSSLEYWEERSEAITTGVYRDEADYDNIRLLEAKGLTFSFVGITELTNGLSLPAGSDVVILLGAEEEKIKARLEEAKALSDVVVVNIHWGNEYTFVPTERQRYLAQKMAEWGADIIIGHHPHVIQPIEYLDKPDGGQTLVAYSLGNFISAQDKAPRMIGGMLDIDVTKDFETNTLSITRCDFIPMITHYDKGFANNRLYALSDYTAELAAAHGVRAYSPEFSLDYIYQTIRDVIDEEFLSQLSDESSQS